jgi:hypothetical protein
MAHVVAQLRGSSGFKPLSLVGVRGLYCGEEEILPREAYDSMPFEASLDGTDATDAAAGLRFPY